MVATWAIVERLDGYVDSMEGGQTDWAPIFRSRRLSDGSKFRVQSGGKASLNLADRSRFIFSADHHPILVEIEAFEFKIDRHIVFDIRKEQVIKDVLRSLGIGHGRFELEIHGSGGGALAARG